MNKNSIKAIFSVLIFLTSKIGVALNVHYCGGHIQEIALAWNVEGCGISLEKSHDTRKGKVTKKHCCQDKTVFIQNNEPQKLLILICKSLILRLNNIIHALLIFQKSSYPRLFL